MIDLRQQGFEWKDLSPIFNMPANALRKAYYRYCNVKPDRTQQNTPKVLIFDIETSPILAHVWALFDQNVALNQIERDWNILSWSAKWLGEERVMYADQSKAPDISDDKDILKQIWDLLDEADIVITQNGIKFDSKKLNARFIMQGMLPPSSYRHVDTLRIAKRYFAFTSNKLEYMTAKLCTKYKKLDHAKFSGFKLWSECLKGNKAAWDEMKEYNCHDVLSLEELYLKLRAWDKTINFNVYSDNTNHTCVCGASEFKKHGFVYTNTAKYRRLICESCGAESRETENLLSKEKRNSLKK
ncbi:MAG: ribonuclease H-like domain-containing protein [Bacteroidales bacterium]